MISHQDQDQEQDQDQILREQVHQKPLKKFPTLQKQLKQELKFNSPTDNLFSPATRKVEAKRNHLLKS